jgi:2-phospho-L-lactate guanylyltransferase
VTGTQHAVVVPVRAFALGKARLAGRLDDDARSALARRMADRVLDAAAAHPVVVVSDAPEVRAWAQARGASVLDDPGSLDGAASAGVAWAEAQGLRRAVIVHADLPRARTLAPLARDGSLPIVVVVPCHRDDGTPAMSLPLPLPPGFSFSYGPGSFRAHVASARRAGLAVRVVRDPDLGFDVDVPEDLDVLSRA